MQDGTTFRRIRRGEQEDVSKRCPSCERPTCATCGTQAANVVQKSYKPNGIWYCNPVCRSESEEVSSLDVAATENIRFYYTSTHFDECVVRRGANSLLYCA